MLRSCDHDLRSVVDPGGDKIGQEPSRLRGENSYTLDAVGKGFAACVELGRRAAGDDLRFFHGGNLREGEPAHDVAVGPFDAGDVGEEDEGVSLRADGAGGGHLVGVDVVIFAIETEGNGGDDGNGAHGPDSFEPTRIGGSDLADEAEVGISFFLAGAEDVAVSAGETDRGLAVRADSGDK